MAAAEIDVKYVAHLARIALSPEEIVEWCAARLARYKIPRYIEYRDREFSRTPSMRVKKEDLKAEKANLAADSWDREKAMART